MPCHHTIIRALHDLAVLAKDDSSAERAAQWVVACVRSSLPPNPEWTNDFDCAADTYVRAVRMSESARVLYRECRVRSIDVPLSHVNATATHLQDAEALAEDELAKAIKALAA